MSISVIIQQTLIIFAYVLIGWVLVKCKVLSQGDTAVITRLIMTLTLPCSILASTSLDAKASDLLNMLLACLLCLGMMVAAQVCALMAAKKLHFTDARRAIFSGLCAFPNVSFMGFPLCTALMGPRALLYGTATVVAYNILFFTVQQMIFQPGKKPELKAFITPLNIATLVAIVLLACRIHLPDMLNSVCSNVGNMTTPLALMLVGVMLGQGRLMDVFRGKFVYAATIIRNLFWPLVLLGVLVLLPLDRTMCLALMVYAATPCANLTAVFATRYEMEPNLCSRAIMLSTLCSLVTIPLIVMLAQAVL